MPDHKNTNVCLGDRDYSPQFIVELGAQFDFDGNNPEFVDEINYIRSGYMVNKTISDDDAFRIKERAKYLAIKKAVDKFQSEIAKHPTLDLATDMYWGALILDEPKPQTVFPELTDSEITRGKPYYLELIRLVRILETGAQRSINQLSPLPGRKPDYAVECLVRRAADFWIRYLNRKFTVDYHQGAGLTPAFEFVQKLANNIESIADNKIINAMRSEIKQRNKDKELMSKIAAGSQD